VTRAGRDQSADEYGVKRVVRSLSPLVPILTIAGVGLYILLRRAYADYYDSFELTPEDLGFGYVEILGRSVGGISFIIIPVALITHFLTQPRDEQAPGALALSIGSLIVAVFVRQWLLVGLALIAIAVEIRYRAHRVVQWLGVLIIVLLTLDILVRGVALLSEYAETQAAAVRSGVAARQYEAWLGVPLLELRGTPVEVEAQDVEAALDCVMYLGANDGTTFFFDVAREQTVVIASSRVVVRLSPGERNLSSECHS